MRVAVVIPARDEAERITRCLESVARAVAGVPALEVRVVVVADACVDETASMARAFGAAVVEVDGANVGAARAAGVRAVIDGVEWIANTDADSVVPGNWLAHQLELAASGADVVLGTVRPDFTELPDGYARWWHSTHVRGAPAGNVHGANLGVRASSYLLAGGYAADAEHEDTRLVDRLRATGALVVTSDDAEVVTSGRRMGRTPGGYAGFLRDKAMELEAARLGVSVAP